MFGQTFEANDLAIIGLLVVLEGILSIDNALVLGLLAKRLPHAQQKKALTYGLAGAFVFRFIAILTAVHLLRWRIVKLLGGGYLLYVAINHFRLLHKQSKRHEPSIKVAGAFWPTVFAIEMTDIAFAVDSIVAAIGVVGPAPDPLKTHPKLWVVMIGGMLGVILMRFAAVIFIRLLERFPRFETAAYLMIIIIGGKLVGDWAFNGPEHPNQLDFHHPSSPVFWIFWISMFACVAIGFIPTKRGNKIEAIT